LGQTAGTRTARHPQRNGELILETLPQNLSTWLPENELLTRLLDLKFGDSSDYIGSMLNPVLLDPIRDLLGRPSKEIRGALVRIGFGFGPSLCEKKRETCVQVLELLHSGSLAIDDIQDGSVMRRGAPTLHRKYGTPLTINAGNWLYFWPLDKISEMELAAEAETLVYRLYHRALLRAHMGQALDLGTPVGTISQGQVYPLCISSLELKSGALTALALVLGAAVSGADSTMIHALSDFGHAFGIALQMFDDIGNVVGLKDPSKRWEDLILGRPSWIWACAALTFSADEYARFQGAIRTLPEVNSVPAPEWLNPDSNFLEVCREKARDFLRLARENFIDRVGHGDDTTAGPIKKICDLCETLLNAY
jgi:geranylgeranyl pyrophosphate synthase